MSTTDAMRLDLELARSVLDEKLALASTASEPSEQLGLF
jgi:hypothetical protein